MVSADLVRLDISSAISPPIAQIQTAEAACQRVGLSAGNRARLRVKDEDIGIQAKT